MTLQCLQPQYTGIHQVLTERQSGIGYDFAMRATPVYFQWSGLTMRQNGIERVPRLHLLCTRVSIFVNWHNLFFFLPLHVLCTRV